jgi:hypothetical protein
MRKNRWRDCPITDILAFGQVVRILQAGVLPWAPLYGQINVVRRQPLVEQAHLLVNGLRAPHVLDISDRHLAI